MLNKKTAFKPKAAIRRPAPGSAPQAGQRPSPVEPSKTPALQEPASESQLAAQLTPSAPPVSANVPAADTVAPPQAQEKEVGKTAVEESLRTSISSTAEAAVTDAREERSAASAQPKRSEAPVPKAQRTAIAADTATSAVPAIPPEAPTALADTAVSTRQISSKAPATAPISPAARPISAGRVQFDAHQDQPVQQVASADDSTGEQTHSTTEPPESTTVPTEAAKPTRGRKRTTTPAAAEDSGEQSTPAPAAKRPRKRAAALPGEEGYQPAAPRTTGNRKRDRSAAEDGEIVEEGEEGTARSRRKLPLRTQREGTPADAENVEIDVTQVKMADLAKDMHIGKKFSLHDELMERERAKRLRYQERRKRQQNGEDVDGNNTPVKEGETPAAGSSSTDANTSTQPTPAETSIDPDPPSTNRAPIGETYQIIDGEIVLDHRSLQVDRHARAREEAGELVEVEENDFTHHTTTATYLRRNMKPQQWTDDETELFYQALSAFGTDFDTICRMFKNKTRKHIKLKFNREERVNPARINAALVGQKTVSIDMEAYKKATGQEYETAEAIYAEQKKAEEEFEARQKALEDEKAEEVRRKKEEVLAQLNSTVEGEGQKKGKGRGRKKKQNFVGL
ncbi:hypothetical protein VTI74DRAFT_1493 [Chaetomium olivicolor]